jgi:replicative DNA helicase
MNDQNKALPHSIEAEQSVIGALLMDNDSIDRAGDLRAEHFYLSDHAAIFDEIIKQISSGKSCDLISIVVKLNDRVPDCMQYLNSVIQNTPSSASIARYSAIVRDKAMKRGLILMGKDIADKALNSHEESIEIIDQASSKLEKLSESRIRQEPVKASDDMAVHINEIELRLEGGTKAIPTGFVDIDDKLNGGIRRGELIVVAARPKMGKTGFALNLACNVSVDYSVLFLSMEMPRAQIHDRNIASLGRIPLPHLLRPEKMSPHDWSSLTAAIAKIENMNLYLDDQGGLGLLDVRLKAKTMKRKHGLDLLVLDYLQLMEGKGDNRNAQIEGITRGLKALAKELDIGIVLLSQLNRELEKRPNKRPQPSDLRDSGAIEQDADAVIFLYRDEVYNLDTQDKGVCEINIALCRQGAPGLVALAYIGIQTRFENMSREWKPQNQEEKKRSSLASML